MLLQFCTLEDVWFKSLFVYFPELLQVYYFAIIIIFEEQEENLNNMNSKCKTFLSKCYNMNEDKTVELRVDAVQAVALEGGFCTFTQE